MKVSLPKGTLELDEKEFARVFLGTMLKNGFDSMKKRDLDVLLFHCLCEHGNLSGERNNQLSLFLQIPESKVASLRREARLRFGNVSDKWVRDETYRLLSLAKLEVKSQKIKFPVEDPLLKDCLNAHLKKMGRYGDSSFNSEILVVDAEAFGELIVELLGEDDSKKVQQRLLSKDSSAPEVKSLFKIAAENFMAGASDQAGRKVVDLSVFFLTGGACSVPKVANGLAKLLDKSKNMAEADPE